MSIHPISFSIPKCKIVSRIYPKTKFISSLIPGDTSTYIYNTEQDYYDEYRQSMFALTKKKAGWDCMRHYEILANGCIPYFPDISNCPKNTMTTFPKELIKRSNELVKNRQHPSLPLYRLFLDYTKHYLTTEYTAKYVLEKSNHLNNVNRILFLSGDVNPDYLRCLTLHGFKELFGFFCHDYPKINHLYKDNSKNDLYGKGFSYTGLLDSFLHNDIFDKTIEQDIQNHLYDLIIYGSYHRGMPFYNTVMKYYDPQDVILLCGEDEPHSWNIFSSCRKHYDFVKKGHHVFVRELP